MIKLEKVVVRVSQGTPLEKVVLNELDLRVAAGEFVTVLGTNGAGKSTLLNVLAGECIPSEGSIVINEEDVTGLESYERAGWVARVFQDPLLGSCGDLTIAENLALAGRRGQTRGLKRALSNEVRERARETLAKLRLGLESRMDTPMNQLSGGQRQAVSLVMSTLSPMKVLLLDEHTSALDPKTANQIMELTQQIIHENQLTALMVTHSLSQALSFGSRTILLHGGVVVRDWSAKERATLGASDLLELYQ